MLLDTFISTLVKKFLDKEFIRRFLQSSLTTVTFHNKNILHRALGKTEVQMHYYSHRISWRWLTESMEKKVSIRTAPVHLIEVYIYHQWRYLVNNAVTTLNDRYIGSRCFVPVSTHTCFNTTQSSLDGSDNLVTFCLFNSNRKSPKLFKISHIRKACVRFSKI